MNKAIEILGGIFIDSLVSIGFKSEIKDYYKVSNESIGNYKFFRFEKMHRC